MELFSTIFCQSPADARGAAGPDTTGDSASPWPRGGNASDAMFNRDASTTRPRPPGAAGKRKQRDHMQGVEESDSAAVTMPGKRRRAAQEHILSERVRNTSFSNLRALAASLLTLACIVGLMQRRRDRINEMMALQELIPHCNKVVVAIRISRQRRYDLA
jgi:hypothetical protein